MVVIVCRSSKMLHFIGLWNNYDCYRVVHEFSSSHVIYVAARPSETLWIKFTFDLFQDSVTDAIKMWLERYLYRYHITPFSKYSTESSKKVNLKWSTFVEVMSENLVPVIVYIFTAVFALTVTVNIQGSV